MGQSKQEYLNWLCQQSRCRFCGEAAEDCECDRKESGEDDPIDFYEIDKKGNHVLRICGGDEESKQRRGNLMRFSEDMYKVLIALLDEYQITELDSEVNVSSNWILARDVIAKAEGKE